MVSAVDVHNTALKGTVVPFGSSVVDGIGSTNCGPGCTQLGADRRWTDDLARRIVAESPGPGARRRQRRRLGHDERDVVPRFTRRPSPGWTR